MKVIKRKHEALVDIGSRRLIYPLDTTFIHDLDPNLANKWINAAWDLKNTNRLEIDSPTIPIGQPATSCSSRLLAGLIYAWSDGVYFRVVIFSKGFFDNQNNLSLKINVWHEKQHVINYERHVHDGSRILSEDDVVKKEVKYVLETFGEKGFYARRDEILALKKRFRNADAIPGFLTVLFLREYFGRYIRRYTGNSFSIPATEYAKSLCQTYAKNATNTINAYNMFDKSISNIFRYTLQDIYQEALRKKEFDRGG